MTRLDSNSRRTWVQPRKYFLSTEISDAVSRDICLLDFVRGVPTHPLWTDAGENIVCSNFPFEEFHGGELWYPVDRPYGKNTFSRETARDWRSRLWYSSNNLLKSRDDSGDEKSGCDQGWRQNIYENAEFFRHDGGLGVLLMWRGEWRDAYKREN